MKRLDALLTPTAPRITLLCLLAVHVTGCTSSDDADSCTSASDCYSNEVCHRSRCTLWSPSEDDPASSDGDHNPSQPAGDTPLPPGPRTKEHDTSEEEQVDASPDHTRDQDGEPSTGETGRPWPDASDPHYTTGQGQPEQADPTEGEEMPPLEDSSLARCTDALPPIPGELILNEVLMNVPAGDDGDANADGVRDAYDDEFVELVNASSNALRLDGVELLVNDNLRHTFGADVCLRAGDAVVLFSGPRDRPTLWRERVLFVAPHSKLGLNNSAGKIELWDALDRVLFSLSYEDARKTSYVLWPELTGTLFVPHDTVSDALFSPGRCADATALHEGCPLPPPAMDEGGDMEVTPGD